MTGNIRVTLQWGAFD